jgi:hypothetical protein
MNEISAHGRRAGGVIHEQRLKKQNGSLGATHLAP